MIDQVLSADVLKIAFELHLWQQWRGRECIEAMTGNNFTHS
jgi:hypothetical protein